MNLRKRYAKLCKQNRCLRQIFVHAYHNIIKDTSSFTSLSSLSKKQIKNLSTQRIYESAFTTSKTISAKKNTIRSIIIHKLLHQM